jgi:hypothetical protein
LTGVQNTLTKTISLDVNGTLQQTVPYTFTPVQATGSTRQRPSS